MNISNEYKLRQFTHSLYSLIGNWLISYINIFFLFIKVDIIRYSHFPVIPVTQFILKNTFEEANHILCTH